MIYSTHLINLGGDKSAHTVRRRVVDTEMGIEFVLDNGAIFTVREADNHIEIYTSTGIIYVQAPSANVFRLYSGRELIKK